MSKDALDRPIADRPNFELENVQIPQEQPGVTFAGKNSQTFRYSETIVPQPGISESNDMLKTVIKRATEASTDTVRWKGDTGLLAGVKVGL